MRPVSTCNHYYTWLWDNSPEFFPDFTPEYTPLQQTERENIFENFIRKLNSKGSLPASFKQRINDPSEKVFSAFGQLLSQVFGYPDEQLSIILSDEFRNVSRDFYYKARSFGPELTPSNIYQGLRNVWIMNGIQLMMNLPVEITPSVFAYSMIYPYSDNFLDDPAVSPRDKQLFSERFDRKLHGEHPEPQSFIETQLFRLVEMFSEQYPRNRFPCVYESLYAIQKAQTSSLTLLDRSADPKLFQKICFEKGGTSVVADGYLVAGNLTPEQEEALFGYGVYLQLLDDIQDMEEDKNAGTNTLFINCSEHCRERLFGKTVHFGRQAMEKMKVFQGNQNEVFFQLMNKSIENMIIESAGLNSGCYSNDFLQKLENFSPLRFDYIRNKKSMEGSQRFALFRKYFEQSTQPEVK